VQPWKLGAGCHAVDNCVAEEIVLIGDLAADNVEKMV
jgi:hypothetical protein